MPTLVINSQPGSRVCPEGRVFQLQVLHLDEINQGVHVDRDEGSPRQMIPACLCFQAGVTEEATKLGRRAQGSNKSVC